MNETLREIGLTDSEIKVYLSLLELGDSTKYEITTKSKVTGSKTYEILERLKQKGLISTYKKNNIKRFKAAHPNQIKNYLDDKKNKIKEKESQINQIMPQLIAKFVSNQENQEVELYTGLKGLQIIFYEQIDLLKSGEYNYVIGGTKGANESAVYSFFQKIHKLRANKKIKTKMLYNERQKESVNKQYSSYKFTEVKFIKHTSPVAINIYKNRTVIIIFGSEISSIMIKSQDVADSFKEYFEMLWK